MNRAARLLAACLAAPLALLTLFTTTGTGQQPSQEFLKGTHAFRFVLHDLQFEPLNDLPELFQEPHRNILIVLGDTFELDNNSGDLIHRFVERGGALLVATDHHVSQTRRNRLTWAGEFGIEVVEQPVLGPERVCYQGLKECPLVQPEGDSLLFAFLQHPVATNLPGFLRVQGSPHGLRLNEWARLPWSCHAKHGTLRDDQFLCFAAGRAWGEGRVLVLADHSVFINNMMLQSDTGNVDFTYNCLRWLRNGGAERRSHVLLYDDGQIVHDFNVPVKMPPPGLPEIDDPVALADKLIAGLEDEDMHNRLLMDWLDPDHEDADDAKHKARALNVLLKWLAIAGTITLAAVGLLRLGRARHRQEPTAPLLAPTMERMAPVRVGLAERYRALLTEGNLWEPARALARDFFEMALGTPDPPTPPPFQANESWLTRRVLHKQVLLLWQLAHGPPLRIAPNEFTRIAAQVDEMRAALADGTLRFTGTV
jgi:hypothetical protein